MKKFWSWLEMMSGFNEFHWKNKNRENWKKSLIGHMLAYLEENQIKYEWDNGIGTENIFSCLEMFIDRKIEI